MALWLLPLKGMLSGGRATLVIFDEPDPAHVQQDSLDALMLRQLLGHFETAGIDLVSTGEYKEGQAKKYDIIFYVGTKDDMTLPTYLLDDLFFRKGELIWIGANLDSMAARHNLESFGLRQIDDTDNHPTNRVEYKKKSLWKLDTHTYAVEVVNPEIDQVVAWAIADPSAKPPSGHNEMYGPEVIHAGQPAPTEADLTALSMPPLDPKLNFDIEPLPQPTPEPKPEISKEERLPWVVRGKKFWYVASNPFSYNVEGGAYLAFCDVLHDMMSSGIKEAKHPGFVRLEDVHAMRNGTDLIAAADYLQSKKVPFSFTLVPVYVNPATDQTVYLSSSPEFLEVVRGLINRGGTPILHGYTHQHTGESAVDYEFWATDTDVPIAQGPEYAAERALRGLSECFLADIFPLAWTTPHYAAGQVDYESLHNYFTTVVERRQPIDKLGSDQFFPYVIYRDMHQQIILPENLGYIQPAAGRDAAAILQDADNSLVVRDGWGSFFFHTFLDLQLLKDVVEGMGKLGYEWVDLRDFNNKVRTEDTVAISGVGQIDLTLKSQYLKSMTLDLHGKRTDETYSFRPVTGNVSLFASTHQGEIQVYQGAYTAPPYTFKNITKFRPAVSGITNPIAIFLLFVGLAILIVFLVIWIFLLSRKATQEFRNVLRARGRG
ncbi:MAG: DUF2334 domain-containing protein [Myxococcales bacterium]|nr:DUF2334 domain-containing protein [Myxococcales bacterium]